MSDLLTRAKDVLFHCRRGRYIRVLDGKFAPWISTNGDVPTLAAEAFTDAPNEDVSVFRAVSPEAELRVAAAHQLTKSGVAKDIYILRLLPGDLAACHIRVGDATAGDTGVPAVDREHRDLRAIDPAAYHQLVRLVFERQRNGADLLRQFKRNVVLCELQRLVLTSGKSALAPDAQQRCRKFLETHQSDLPPT